MSLKFVSWHNHTEYSTYDGLTSVDQYCKWLLENAGEDSGAFAITDHGNVSSCGYISAAQKKYGDAVKIIYGNEFYFLPDLQEWRSLKEKREQEKKQQKEEKKKQVSEETDFVIENEEESKSKNKFLDPVNRRNHLVVLAYNQKGLENLFRLTSRSYREGFYRKPRIDLNMLKELNEGLIISSACLAGIPSHASFLARENNLDVMRTYENELGPLMDIFGKERFFLELQFNKIPEQQIINKDMIEFSKKSGLQLVAAADSHHCRPELWKARELYRLLGWQQTKNDVTEKVRDLQEKKIDELECHLYLKNGDQMFESYKSEFKKHYDDDELIKSAIERTHEITHNVFENVHPDSSVKLPSAASLGRKSESSFDKLKKMTLEGLKAKGLEKIKNISIELPMN